MKQEKKLTLLLVSLVSKVLLFLLVLLIGSLRSPNRAFAAPLGCEVSYRANALASQSAYPSDFHTPKNSPWTYVAWVWRETSGVQTNHSLSVARTRDMVNWYNTCGDKLTLPLDVQSRTVVDAIRHNGGLLNNVSVGSDPAGNPIVSYMKYVTSRNASGVSGIATQIFNARFKNNTWTIHQMTDWTTQYYLSGGGALPINQNSVSFSNVEVTADGRMFQSFRRGSLDSDGLPSSGTYLLNVESMALEGRYRNDDPNPLRRSPPARPAETSIPRHSPAGFSTSFLRSLVFRSFDLQWFAVQGNFESPNALSHGLFDQASGTFRIWHPDGRGNSFHIGQRQEVLLPLVGKWNTHSESLDGMGIFRPRDNAVWLSPGLQSGPGHSFFSKTYLSVDDFLEKFDYVIKDGPFADIRRETYDPRLTSFLVYDTLPSNGDRPYDCTGRTVSSSSHQWKSCSQKFVTDLYLYEFDPQSNAWSKTFIDKVWGGMRVRLSLVKDRDLTVVSYYDSARMVKVALRKGTSTWEYKTLDSQFEGFDSHNYLTMFIDEKRTIHLSGNLHNNGLNYWRTTATSESGSPIVSSLRRFAMTGSEETKTTYPKFFRGPNGDLLFTYRYGVSGSGIWIINRYDPLKKTWTRLMQRPLFGDGRAALRRSARHRLPLRRTR
jgi:hypothetical protein